MDKVYKGLNFLMDYRLYSVKITIKKKGSVNGRIRTRGVGQCIRHLGPPYKTHRRPSVCDTYRNHFHCDKSSECSRYSKSTQRLNINNT